MEIFTQPVPSALAPLVPYAEAFASKVHLNSFPLHVHHVIGALVVYHMIFVLISPALSKLLVPQFYNNFNRRTKVNWDVHVVSFVQSSFICALALWGIFTDETRQIAGADPTEAGALYRVFGYTVTGGAVQGYATGYFIWDLFICIYHFDIMGFGFVAHAVTALSVFSLGFRPFVNYYAPIFILFELSSPFLNIHWFCDKVNLTGSKVQLINGFALLTTFFCCRLCWGTYNSVLVFKDIFGIYANPPPATHPSPEELLVGDAMGGSQAVVHPWVGKEVPLWLAVVYLGSNLTLNGLNYWWFSRMIVTVASRFQGPKKEKVEVGGAIGKRENGTVFVEGSDIDVGTPTEMLRKRTKKA